ncbi:MAG: hypothetical protein J2P27_16855 [Actinobacteria bacterium]|nr:hypothetical protein [Actinomycetota bacterium]
MPESSGPGSELFDSQQHLLVEYCRDLTDNEDDAASLAQSVLSSAKALLNDPARLRAWLFALARREALLANQGASDGPGDPDREVLDLVHRHGIQPADLPVVLGISGDEAAGRLAAAEKQLDRLANGETDPALPAVGVRRMVQLLGLRPLALSGRRLQLAVASAVAVAAIASGLYILSDVASTSRNHVAPPGGHPSLAGAPTASQSLAVTPSQDATPAPSASVLVGNQVGVLPGVSPTAGPTLAPRPSVTPTTRPTSPPPSPSPTPSPQPSTSPSPSVSPSPSASPS